MNERYAEQPPELHYWIRDGVSGSQPRRFGKPRSDGFGNSAYSTCSIFQQPDATVRYLIWQVLVLSTRRKARSSGTLNTNAYCLHL